MNRTKENQRKMYHEQNKRAKEKLKQKSQRKLEEVEGQPKDNQKVRQSTI